MSCCGCIFRFIVLVLLLCFTACAILTHFLPLFRLTTTYPGGVTVKQTVLYWYQQRTLDTGAAGSDSKQRLYMTELACDEERKMFIASCSLAVAAVGFGALASLFTIFWMLPCCRCAMGVMVFFFTLLAGLCCAGVFGLLTWGFFHGYCERSPAETVPAFEQDGYKMVEGYILLCVAGLGFFAMALLEAIAYCCVCCCCSGAASRKSRSSGRSEPTHDDSDAKDVPAYTGSTSDNAPYANKKE